MAFETMRQAPHRVSIVNLMSWSAWQIFVLICIISTKVYGQLQVLHPQVSTLIDNYNIDNVQSGPLDSIGTTTSREPSVKNKSDQIFETTSPSPSFSISTAKQHKQRSRNNNGQKSTTIHVAEQKVATSKIIVKQADVLSTDCIAKRVDISERLVAIKQDQNYASSYNNSALPSVNSLGSEHVPICNLQGGYEPIQCHIGYCWCVNKYGQAIKNSAVRGGKPVCDMHTYESESNHLLVVAGISKQRINRLLRPSTINSTTPNGHLNFEADFVTEISEISEDRTAGVVNESAKHEPIMPLIPNDCQTSRINARERAAKHSNDSIWIPDCDDTNEKLYSERQCHRLRVCWCVDQYSGLPLRTSEHLASNSASNCTEVKKILGIASLVTQPARASRLDPAFYYGSSESCDTSRRIDFVTNINHQFQNQVVEYVQQHTVTATTLPPELRNSHLQNLDATQVSKWIFLLMDWDRDGKLGDREWSKFKNHFKLIDKLDGMEQIFRQKKSDLPPLIILRAQRKCWRDFLEFCGNGNLLNDESISLTKWLSCTELPPATVRNSDAKAESALFENTHANSREAAIARSKKKNPFLGILKPD